MVKNPLSIVAICKGKCRKSVRFRSDRDPIDRFCFMTRRRIIIVDDHPLFRAALRQTLAGGDATVSVEEAGDLTSLSAALDADRDCDLVLLDLNMPGVRGF